MKILVLGAGVIGTASAWYLARDGHEVTVIDRQPLPGNETSFANGSQISVSHAEPWANPHVLPTLVRWLGREDAPLLWRWRADPAQLAWGARFLLECLPSRTRHNIAAIVALSLYSRQQLQALRQELALEYDQLERGILHLYTDPVEFERAGEAAAIMREFGLDRHQVDVARCLEIEPALAQAKPLLVGGDYTRSDESGDAHKFTVVLAERATAAGVDFRLNTTVLGIKADGERISGVEIENEGGRQTLNADACVVALSSYSSALLKPLGVRLPIYPAKGYSATMTLAEGTPAPTVSLTDDERKIVFSRLGNRLRVAGTAEFNGYNLDLNETRCQALMQRTRQLFPKLEIVGEPEFWCALRPATPSNLPMIGRQRYRNLWLNTGHGTLGWTMACGSGAALADLIGGRRPEADFPFIGC
jgi:D-amino-acid dehydrogenase